MKLWCCRRIPQHNPTFSATVINGNSTQIGLKIEPFCRCYMFLKKTCNLQYNKISQDIIVWESHNWLHMLSLQSFQLSPCQPLPLPPLPPSQCFSVLSVFHPLFSPSHSHIKIKNTDPREDGISALPFLHKISQFSLPHLKNTMNPPQRTPRPGTFPKKMRKSRCFAQDPVRYWEHKANECPPITQFPKVSIKFISLMILKKLKCALML